MNIRKEESTDDRRTVLYVYVYKYFSSKCKYRIYISSNFYFLSFFKVRFRKQLGWFHYTTYPV